MKKLMVLLLAFAMMVSVTYAFAGEMRTDSATDEPEEATQVYLVGPDGDPNPTYSGAAGASIEFTGGRSYDVRQFAFGPWEVLINGGSDWVPLSDADGYGTFAGVSVLWFYCRGGSGGFFWAPSADQE